MLKFTLISTLFWAVSLSTSATIIEADNKKYEIGYLVGTFLELRPKLEEQVWWNDSDLALIFAETLKRGIELPRPGSTRLHPLLFSYTDFKGSAGENFNTGVANYVDFSPTLPPGAYQGSARIIYPFAYAIATPIPVPSSISLILCGCVALGLRFRVSAPPNKTLLAPLAWLGPANAGLKAPR